MRACGGIGGRVPLILEVGTRWRSVVSLVLWLL